MSTRDSALSRGRATNLADLADFAGTRHGQAQKLALVRPCSKGPNAGLGMPGLPDMKHMQTGSPTKHGGETCQLAARNKAQTFLSRMAD